MVLLLSALLLPANDEAMARPWSIAPLKAPAWPVGAEPHPIDRFVLAGLSARGLPMSPEADKLTLLRRAHIDLTGLLPTPEETRAFLADTAPGAWDRLLDRLLASPAY
ncbi:MAG: DUF1549 domain-containing protein, partial [Planctomycetes bacterium]|nr:DUF1549 domain-containing protein [Planctomycetota bacterium]